MKRAIPLLLLCLLLSGCGAEPRSLLPALPTEETLPPIPSGCYDPDSSLERQYPGVVQVFPLGQSDVTGIRVIGSGILVFSGEQTTRLTVLKGESLSCAASRELGFLLDPRDPSLRIWKEQLAFYDPVQREMLLLDDSLEVLSRIPAPENLQGSPILSEDGNLMYYCTPSSIRVWDQASGFHRFVREITCPGQALVGLDLHDTVLRLQYVEEENVNTLFISAQTGRLLSEQNGDVFLDSSASTYFVSLPEALDQTLLWGAAGAKPQLFLPRDGAESCHFLPAAVGAVTVFSPEPGKQRLDYYSLLQGRRLSSLILESQEILLSLDATAEGCVFLLLYAPDYQCHTLYRWEAAGENDNSSLDPERYTAPYLLLGERDPEGLAQCQAYAESLSEKYGIRIRIAQDAAAPVPPGYELTMEHQTGILRRELTKLDQHLKHFPGSILPDTISHFSSLTISIVGDITGAAESGSSLPAAGAQFFLGSDAYIVIASGQASEGALYRGLYQVMETRLLTKSAGLDQWDALNPFGFHYSYGGKGRSMKSPEYYLLPENRAFVDVSSTDSPTADRAAVLEAAMLPGNQALFRHVLLQEKLKALCQGIREAYSLKQHPDAFLWEQYLLHPLAYQAP